MVKIEKKNAELRVEIKEKIPNLKAEVNKTILLISSTFFQISCHTVVSYSFVDVFLAKNIARIFTYNAKDFVHNMYMSFGH